MVIISFYFKKHEFYHVTFCIPGGKNLASGNPSKNIDIKSDVRSDVGFSFPMFNQIFTTKYCIYYHWLLGSIGII